MQCLDSKVHHTVLHWTVLVQMYATACVWVAGCCQSALLKELVVAAWLRSVFRLPLCSGRFTVDETAEVKKRKEGEFSRVDTTDD